MLNRVRIFVILAAVIVLAAAPLTGQAQQISPNPNNGTITIDTSGAYNIENPFDNMGSGIIDITGTGMLSNSGTVNNYGILTNNGTLTNFNQYGASTLNNSGTLTNNGTLRVQDSFFPSNAIVGSTLFNGYGTLDNNAGGTLTIDTYSVLSNSGTVNNYGILTNNGTLTNFNQYGASTLNNSGTLTNNGTLRVQDSFFPSNAIVGSTLFNGYGTLDNNAGGTLTIDTHSVLSNSGTVNNYGILTNNGTLANAGTLLNSGTINGAGSYQQTSGQTANTGSMSQASIDIQGGAFTNAGGTLYVDSFTNAGSFKGTGTINPLGGGLVSFTNAGMLAPGLSPGTLAITGNFVQTHAGLLNIELSGLTQGTGYDFLTISGRATLAGTLDVDLLGGFAPQPGDVFDILHAAGGINGTFDSLDLPLLLAGWHWDVDYTATDVLLRLDQDGGSDPAAVPEPGTVLLLGLGLAGVAVARRKFRK